MTIARPTARVVAFAVVGGLVGLALGARASGAVGPFECTAIARPSLTGETLIRLAPLGSIRMDTHTAPVAVELRVDELRREEAERIAADPDVLDTLEDDIAAGARRVLQALAVRAVLAAAVGGILGALAARVSLRNLVIGGTTGAVVAGAITAAATITFRPEAVAEPQYSGLLSVAPRAVGDVEALVERFDDYRAQLTDLVGNVAAIYRTAEGLPTLPSGDDAIRVLHVSDLHNNPQGLDLALELAAQFDVDVVVDTGDLTDWGTTGESRLFRRIALLPVPYVYVRGNHDSASTEASVEARGGIVLDGDVAVVAGLRFWGIGDPRFTPDKDQPTGHEVEAAQIEAFAPLVEERVRYANPATIDVVLVHDRRAASGLADLVPLVLAGHTHAAREDRFGDTIVLTEGSTGGAGLRALEGEEPEPLACSVLYFDPDTRRLIAYDRITVAGLGEAGVRIERHVVTQTEEVDADGGS